MSSDLPTSIWIHPEDLPVDLVIYESNYDGKCIEYILKQPTEPTKVRAIEALEYIVDNTAPYPNPFHASSELKAAYNTVKDFIINASMIDVKIPAQDDDDE